MTSKESEASGETDPAGILRSYGRRKGHKLTDRKAELVANLLPALRLDLSGPAPSPLSALFQTQVREVWLEIGFGGGEHLAHQARDNPDIGFIGCEPFLNGIASLLTSVEEEELRNIRVHDGDAREVLAWLPDASIARLFMLFPDPWPKKRHKKRRLLNSGTAAEIARVLKPGGRFRFASDIDDYLAQALIVLRRDGRFHWTANTASDWRNRPPDACETRYEKKARREGRQCRYLDFRRG